MMTLTFLKRASRVRLPSSRSLAQPIAASLEVVITLSADTCYLSILSKREREAELRTG